MDGWKLTFKYKRGANVIELELIGNDAAIQLGLNLAARTVGQKVKTIISRGGMPDGLAADAARLYTIQTGSPVSAYKGKFLNIVPAARVSGLSSTMNVQWKD